MNPKLLQLMGYREDLYPHRLEREFPQILKEIESRWGNAGCDDYLRDLTLVERDTRQGFPPEVAVELFHLAALHEAQMRLVLGRADDIWEGLPEDDHRGTRNFGDDW